MSHNSTSKKYLFQQNSTEVIREYKYKLVCPSAIHVVQDLTLTITAVVKLAQGKYSSIIAYRTLAKRTSHVGGGYLGTCLPLGYSPPGHTQPMLVTPGGHHWRHTHPPPQQNDKHL